MKRRIELINAFVVAILLHAGVGYCAARMLSSGESPIVPVFKMGETGVTFDLVPVSTIQAEPEPVQVVEEVKELPTPELEPVRTIRDISQAGPESPAERSEPAVPVVANTGVDNTPMLKAQVHPFYPLGARKRGEEGVVRVRVEVERGKAGSVEIVESSGYPALDKAAKEALQKAEFVRENGVVAPNGETVLAVRFTLID